MKRISIFMPVTGTLGEHLGTYDRTTKRWSHLNHRLVDASGKLELRMLGYLEVVGLSHNCNDWQGPYERNAKGEILAGHIPKRMTTDELMEALAPKPDGRGKNAESLKALGEYNLKNAKDNPNHPLHHLIGVSQFDDNDFEIATMMRDAGCTWKQVGLRLNRHSAAIKTAFWRRQKETRGSAGSNLL
jgi:hypothetical protein